MSEITNTAPCRRCEHPADWHRLDDGSNVSPTDPAAEFRCIGYDCTTDGGFPKPDARYEYGRACDCPDFVEPDGHEDDGSVSDGEHFQIAVAQLQAHRVGRRLGADDEH